MSASDRNSSLPSVERLRKEAKKLLRLCRAGDAQAADRVRSKGERQLADAQHAVAGEHGFASWAALKRHAEAQEPLGARAERFLAAVRDYAPERARKLGRAHPAIAGTSVYAACA